MKEREIEYTIIPYLNGWHIIDQYGTEYGVFDTYREALENL